MIPTKGTPPGERDSEMALRVQRLLFVTWPNETAKAVAGLFAEARAEAAKEQRDPVPGTCGHPAACWTVVDEEIGQRWCAWCIGESEAKAAGRAEGAKAADAIALAAERLVFMPGVAFPTKERDAVLTARDAYCAARAAEPVERRDAAGTCRACEYECDVCGGRPDKDGDLKHGKGCYTQSSEGGGVEFFDHVCGGGTSSASPPEGEAS